jgi:carbonic anhydrase/acetyltransferase-like protein (isoleucine patch superfamily)
MQSNLRDNVRSLGDCEPKSGERVFVDPSAVVIGDVELGDDVSVWPQASIRGDVHKIRIGARTSIQDGSVLHVTHAGPFNPQGWPLQIGCDVTVGHNATLHGCAIGDRVLVGMGATVMDGAVVEDEVVIAAGALVTPGKQLRSGYLYGGHPAREMRALTDREQRYFLYSAANYVGLKDRYLAERANQPAIRPLPAPPATGG